MKKSQYVILNEVKDSDILPLDLIESKVKFKLYQLNNNEDSFLSLSILDINSKSTVILRLKNISNIHNNLDFVVNIITQSLTICNLTNIRSLKITYGNHSR